jgi:hypothetical protein
MPIPIRFQIAGFRSRRSANPTTLVSSSVHVVLGVSIPAVTAMSAVPAMPAFPPPALLIEEAIGADLFYV